jgi:hypothetical protein
MFHLAFHNLVDLFFVFFCCSWGVSSNIKASLSSSLSNEGNQYKGCKDFNKHTWHCCFCQSLARMSLGLSSALIVWSGQFCHCIPCIVVLLSIFSICNCSASCFAFAFASGFCFCSCTLYLFLLLAFALALALTFVPLNSTIIVPVGCLQCLAGMVIQFSSAFIVLQNWNQSFQVFVLHL